jgi:hypothetical protein
MMTWRHAWAVTWLAASAAGCSTAHQTVNQPLADTRLDTGYAIRNLAAPDNSDSMVVLVAFSGGGYRAAALALAEMELLHDSPSSGTSRAQAGRSPGASRTCRARLSISASLMSSPADSASLNAASPS